MCFSQTQGTTGNPKEPRQGGSLGRLLGHFPLQGVAHVKDRAMRLLAPEKAGAGPGAGGADGNYEGDRAHIAHPAVLL